MTTTMPDLLQLRPRADAPPVSILMYHQVGHFDAPTAHRAVYCDAGRFDAQMRFLHRFGYGVISLEDAWRGLFEGAPLPARAVVLSFDDGYDNFHQHAWPSMQRFGFTPTVFLVAGLDGAPARWLDAGREQPRLMDGATIRRLRREGVHFGSHAMSHLRLATLDAAAQRAEIFDSKKRLEDLLGEAVPDFCYPYGSYDLRARDLVAEAGYRSGLTCIRGSAHTADNPFEIPRKAISWGDNLAGYWWKLHMKHARKNKGGAADAAAAHAS